MMGLNHTGDWGPYTFYTKPNRTMVFYLRAPPKVPPSYKQLNAHWAWTLAANNWTAAGADVQAQWNLAAQRARLSISGINLWMYYQLTGDRAAIQTIQRQSHVDLGL